MDAGRFETLLRSFATSPSRRAALRGLVGSALVGALGWSGSEIPAVANKKKKKGNGGGGNQQKGGKKKGKGKKKERRAEECGPATCTNGTFCCDDARGVCCQPGSACCNAAPGTGTCCVPPNDCAKPLGNDNAPYECCPPERLFTGFGEDRCCPRGTRSLGTEISSDDGPCCPEEKYCSHEPTGGKCCPDVAPVCLNRSTGQCCSEDQRCGDSCCSGPFGDCCGGQCRLSEFGPWTPCGDFCCPGGKVCCTNGSRSLCCDPGDVCPAPCGDLDIACCTPESFALGHCCNTGCDPVTGCAG
jgi:hypothetical protein